MYLFAHLSVPSHILRTYCVIIILVTKILTRSVMCAAVADEPLLLSPYKWEQKSPIMASTVFLVRTFLLSYIL